MTLLYSSRGREIKAIDPQHCMNQENFCGAWCHCVCTPCREIRIAEQIAKDREQLRRMTSTIKGRRPNDHWISN